MDPVREQMAELRWPTSRSRTRASRSSRNASGELVTTADAVREALLAQISSPVRWVDCVETLAASGVDTSLELGPGRMLIGLVRQIREGTETAAADSPKKLGKFTRDQASRSGF